MKKDQDHFIYIYWFVCALCLLIFGYQVAITFIHVPKENVMNANTAMAYLMGVMSTAAAFLIGNNPKDKKADPLPNTTAVELSTVSTTLHAETNSTNENNKS